MQNCREQYRSLCIFNTKNRACGHVLNVPRELRGTEVQFSSKIFKNYFSKNRGRDLQKKRCSQTTNLEYYEQSAFKDERYVEICSVNDTKVRWMQGSGVHFQKSAVQMFCEKVNSTFLEFEHSQLLAPPSLKSYRLCLKLAKF